MKLNLFCDENNKDEHVDIYYSHMRPEVQRVIDAAGDKVAEIISKYEDETVYVPIKDVYYLDCADKKVFAYMKKQVYPLEETLAYYEELLASYGYVRVSKSTIVNVFHIKEMKSEINMRICATFDNAEKIYINRSYKASFLKFLKEMRGSMNRGK